LDLVGILLAQYAFGEVLSLAVAQVGVGALATATAAFLGLAGYLAAAPFRGVFWNTRPRVIVFGYIQQLVYVLSFLLLLISLSSLLQFVIYYLPVFVSTVLNVVFLARLQSFESMVNLRNAGRSLRSGPTNLLGIASVWGVFGIEMWLLIKLNPTLSLIVWLFLFHTYLMALLQAALTQGILFQVRNSPYVKVISQDQKEFNGFVLGKGSDHYVLAMKEGEIVIQSNFVKYMVEQEVPKMKSVR